MFLHYAWHNDSCFPRQERLAVDMGMSQSRSANSSGAGSGDLIEIKRRGMGKTTSTKSSLWCETTEECEAANIMISARDIMISTDRTMKRLVDIPLIIILR